MIFMVLKSVADRVAAAAGFVSVPYLFMSALQKRENIKFSLRPHAFAGFNRCGNHVALQKNAGNNRQIDALSQAPTRL